MLPHGGPHMASSSAPATDNGAKFTLLGQHPTHYNTNHYNMGPDFSLGAFQQQQPQQQQHDHVPHHHSLVENHPLLASQTRELLEPLPQRGREGFSDFNHGYLFSTNQGFGSNYAGHDSYGTLATKPSMTDGHFLPSFSLEALLDTLSVIQQKVQQLQGTVQVMAQGGGQQTSPHQQHALSATVTSIISQLVAASASLLQHTCPPSQHAPAIYPPFSRSVSGGNPHVHDIQQDSMSSPLFSALPSFLIGSQEENFHVPGSRNFSDAVANLGHGQSLRGEIADLGTFPTVSADQKPAIHSTILSASNPDTVAGKTDGSHHPTTTVDSLVATTAINRLAVSNGMNGSAEFDKGAKGITAGTCSQPGLDRSANIGVPSPDDHDHDSTVKDDDDNGEGEFLSPGSYELIEMDAAEILAEHTHFCEICGKGFKRDANLRMHMRGHGDEYKTPAALARPDKIGSDPSVLKPRRYSCPYLGCKRNKKHRKFQPLKTMLCVKNHYKRSHCPKMYSCSKCKVKKFSVVADLKTHEKHCGQDKWQCSCGTTFSRKDKLFGHISLFTGHTPALPLDEVETSVGGSDPPSHSLPPPRSESMPYNESSHLSADTREHGNMQLMAGHNQQMDKSGEAATSKALRKSVSSQGKGGMDNSHEELLVVDPSPATSLSGGMASDASIFQDLLTSDFYHQASNST